MKNKELKDILNYQIKNDMKSFLIKSFYEINPKEDFFDAWYLDYLIEHLNLVEQGRIKRLIVNIPPRNAKSIIFNVAFPAWMMMKDASKKIISVSYSSVLSIKHSMDFRRIVKSKWFESLNENFQINKAGLTKQKITTNENGFRFATSVNGTLVGDGCDIMIVDDPNNPIDIHSKAKRDKVNQWFVNSALTRLNNKNSALIIVMQRLHNDDLTGFIKDNLASYEDKEWTFLEIPFLITKNSKFYLQGNLFFDAKEDTTINRNRFSVQDAQKLKQQLTDVVFNSQYQQVINSSDSVKIINSKSITFENYDFTKNSPNNYKRILSIDCASVKSNKADYSVIIDIIIQDNIFYIIDIFREKLNYAQMKIKVINLIKSSSPNFVLVENKNNGIPLSQEIELHANIVKINPKIDKISRVYKVLHIIENNMVKICVNDFKRRNLFFDEIDLFPNAKNDDQVDALTQVIQWYLDECVNSSKVRKKDIKFRMM